MIELPVIRTGLVIGTIDLIKQKVVPDPNNPVWFKCQSKADCCSQMKIPASSYDINRIMDHGYELDQIIKEASPIILNANSKHGPREKAYLLKSKPFDGTCTFLEDNLCKIHEFKPFACQLYPFALEFIDDTTIQLVIHQEQLCETIKAVDKSKAMNKRILEEKMEIITSELHARGYSIEND